MAYVAVSNYRQVKKPRNRWWSSLPGRGREEGEGNRKGDRREMLKEK